MPEVNNVNLLYVTNSTIDSAEANRNQIINQLTGLLTHFESITLVVAKEKFESEILDDNAILRAAIRGNRIKLVIPNKFLVKAFRRELAIAIMALLCGGFFKYRSTKQLVYSRNLYFVALASLFQAKRLSIAYEHHSVEQKHIRPGLQRLVQRLIKNIYISNSLRQALATRYSYSVVLHDAGIDTETRNNAYEENLLDSDILKKMSEKKYKIGYFGSIREGSGASLILKLAEICREDNVEFHLFGSLKMEHLNFSHVSNVVFHGRVDSKDVHYFMQKMDVLIMPFQRKVFVSSGINTADYMSPLKMFEYFASNVPVISSDLPVLKEVLVDKENCLLAECDDPLDWKNKILMLKRDKRLAKYISFNAKKLIDEKFNWNERAKSIKEFIKNV